MIRLAEPMASVNTPWAEVIKLFFMLNSAEHEIKMLINIEIAKIYGIFRFNPLKPAIYPANKCNCWHFNIYELDKFQAQLS